MLLAQDVQPLPRSSQDRFATAAIVAGLHVVVIAGIIVSLNRPAPPAPPPDITLTRIDPVKQTQPLPPPDPTLARPRVAEVDPPPINVSRDDNTHVITNEGPTQQMGSVDPPVRVMPAQAIMGTHTTPDYPPLDARLGHEGNVRLKLTIDEWGAVTDAQVERSSGYDSLDRAAASWVKTHWLYHPATRAGDPIPSTAEAIVTFQLTGRRE